MPRIVSSEWLLRSMQLTQIAAQSMGTEKHAILCGFGRSGQYLARFLEQENVAYVALDLLGQSRALLAHAGNSVVATQRGRESGPAYADWAAGRLALM